MEQFLSIIRANHEVLTLAAIGLSLISLLMWFINTWRTGRLLKKYNKLMHGMEGRNLEERLTAYVQSVQRALAKTEEVENAYKALRMMAENSVQNVGIVRFNAFDDTGSDLSFALALLDYRGDGIVISSLFGRTESRIYAKPVSKGTSSYHLSDEESEAIRKALRTVRVE